MVAEWKLDPDCMKLDVCDFEGFHEYDFQFQYLASRIRAVCCEVQKRRPRRRCWQWLDVRSDERHQMLMLLLTLLCSTVLGVLALVVALFTLFREERGNGKLELLR
jgi:hypothetical protein